MKIYSDVQGLVHGPATETFTLSDQIMFASNLFIWNSNASGTENILTTKSILSRSP